MLSGKACPERFVIAFGLCHESMVSLHAVDGCVLERGDLRRRSVELIKLDGRHPVSHMKIKDKATPETASRLKEGS